VKNLNGAPAKSLYAPLYLNSDRSFYFDLDFVFDFDLLEDLDVDFEAGFLALAVEDLVVVFLEPAFLALAFLAVGLAFAVLAAFFAAEEWRFLCGEEARVLEALLAGVDGMAAAKASCSLSIRAASASRLRNPSSQPGVKIRNRSMETGFARRHRGQIAS